MKKQLPTAEYLHSVLDYNSETGQLTWKLRPVSHFASEHAQKVFNSKCAGKEAGYRHFANGQPTAIHVRLCEIMYKAHRIAWLMSGREMPGDSMHIDHINGDPHDNRLCNLRLATHAENLWNRGAQSSNHRGIKGVTFDPRRRAKPWYAQIDARGKHYHLGMHYTKAAIRLHGQFARIS